MTCKEISPLKRIESFRKWNTRNIIHNQTSETNRKNIEALKGFPYKSEFRENPKNNKMMVVYTCGYQGCGKEFLRTWNLLDHLRMHKGVRPYECSICLKSFTQKGNMRKHMERHSVPDVDQRKKYQCKVCGNKFTEKYNYKVHYQKQHGRIPKSPKLNY